MKSFIKSMARHYNDYNIHMITIIGGLTIDLTYILNDWPKPNSAVQANQYKLNPGGKGLNFAIAIKRLGLNPNLIASIGYDHFGRSILEALIDERIPTENIVQKNIETSLVGILIDKKSPSPSFIGNLNGTYALERQDVLLREKDIQNSNFLIINNEASPEVIKTAFEIAKKYRVPTVFNPAPPLKTDLKNILPKVNHLFLNEWEANFYLPKMPINKQVKTFLTLGAESVIITRANKGCLVGSKRDIKSFKAFKVKAVDETGAGDAFMSAFLYGVLKKLPLEKCVELGNAAGAITTQTIGSYSGMPNIKQINSFIANHPLL